MAIHILGIRHHGPGSARNVKTFLESVKPDIVLVEGPPEADGILQWAAHEEMRPPVAILCYQPDNPRQSSFYPFAEFSPEWQAILYAKRQNIHIRFMDLPVAHQYALENEAQAAISSQPENAGQETAPSPPQDENTTTVPGQPAIENEVLHEIPVRYDVASLAHAAGYDDGEKWWEHMFEHRADNQDIFTAVMEGMGSLREIYDGKDNKLELLREAHMRKVIRQAEREMFQNIAVICGAWHAPALHNMPPQKGDNELLKGLSKVKTECTWVPWTNSRLSLYSGYGAGINSPGWYEHIWHHQEDDGTKWLVKVAKLFREKQMDTSVAHVIEASRLANALAALRNLPKAGLEELNEATLSVLCGGEPVLLSLVQAELIVNNRIGEVPVDIPKPPLQQDIEKIQKRLRLPAAADWKDYLLDLRKENDLERSVFLHRLQILELKWGHRSDVTGKGTFKEQWRLQWDPGFSVDIIEKGVWGNTVEEAATGYLVHLAKEAADLPAVGKLLEAAIPAELPLAVDALIQRINNLAAASSDVVQLMEVLPGLVEVSRYGNVRKTDAALVMGIVESMTVRICINLPPACQAIDEDAAAHLQALFPKLNDAINLLQHGELTGQWEQTLKVISQNQGTAPVLAGYATRLLADRKLLTGDELVKAFYYAMSSASGPGIAAAWLEGFLTGSGAILLLDNDLWGVVSSWVEQLEEDMFIEVLPLLRRTFSNFSRPERKKLGEMVKRGGRAAVPVTEKSFDGQRAEQGIPVVMALLGLQH
ncbi:DUF5682 family protein [Chitinophaga barathri]|uniref:Uncharacterized protein n=1 Tax=Chitinophaga barathri TaxID=1647451 RepID=A0A3N4M755_9BACT|nr:DUF5682 family protein [Chitinophaga barathri]RPD38995.1 hypothetical protein EG028_22930 [Chitinophaga barathri]